VLHAFPGGVDVRLVGYPQLVVHDDRPFHRQPPRKYTAWAVVPAGTV
jgi:hypothetical protein